ncbi:MAG: acetate/propionate family kinase [Proteobacteria bacterium]|nr:acetate/propionate family kinase [Pseudomonadota bacterium]
MNTMALIDILKTKTELFTHFSDEQLAELLKDSYEKTFEENEGIVEFGEEAHFLGIILEGKAVASVTNNLGEQNVLLTLGPGGIIGLIPMMTGELNPSDIIGVSRCRVLVIPQTVFASLILTHLPTIRVITKMMSKLLHTFTIDEEGRENAARAFGKNRDLYGFKLQSSEPIKIMVINCGASSLKYNLYNTADESLNITGRIIHLGSDKGRHIYTYSKGQISHDLGNIDHDTAFKLMFEQLTDKKNGVIDSPFDVTLVGHRVVHGGSDFETPAVITEDIISKIKDLSPLAPQHNPFNLIGINKGMAFFQDALHVAVFDTAFHHTMPPYAYLYGIPYEFYEQHKIRRYGFHGMSHAYASLKTAEILKRPYNKLEIVTCHLENTASLCAVDHGRSVDTTMGLSPTEGLMMGTRCGDIDPSVILKLMRDKNLSVDELEILLNRESGLKGLSGISNSMPEIMEAANKGDHRALLAFKAFCYRIRKYIGAYIAAMEGIDALVFTGWLGQSDHSVRSQACQGLECMGIIIDPEKNKQASTCNEPIIISTDDSRIFVLVIPTDEERMIARESLKTMKYHAVTHVLKRKHAPLMIEVSAHHVHLTQEHVEALYGKGHTLTPKSELSQPGQFACEEQVALIGPKGRVERVRILGPVRNDTQVEISMTEQFQLGIQPPIRASGNIINTPGITLEGSEGQVTIDKGVICALRHIHMTPEDAIEFGLHDRDVVRVQIHGDRELIFGDVLVRVSPKFKLAMHIDTDEANAAHIRTGVTGHITDIQLRI